MINNVFKSIITETPTAFYLEPQYVEVIIGNAIESVKWHLLLKQKDIFLLQ